MATIVTRYSKSKAIPVAIADVEYRIKDCHTSFWSILYPLIQTRHWWVNIAI